MRGKDAGSNHIVGYSMDARMTADLAVRALRNAVALRGPVETVVHADRGSPRARLRPRAARRPVGRSMGRVGACADNAAVDSFFSLLQKNVLDRQRWSSRDELRHAIVFWIERTYHRRRHQDRLGRTDSVKSKPSYRPLTRREPHPPAGVNWRGAVPAVEPTVTLHH